MKAKKNEDILLFSEFAALYRAVSCPRQPKSSQFDALRLEHFNDSKRAMPPFRCDFFSIMFFSQPNISLKINAVERHIEANTLVFYVPNQIRSFQKYGEWSGYAVYFKPELMFLQKNPAAYRQFPFLNWNQPNFFTLKESEVVSFQPLFEKLLLEAESDVPFQEEFVQAYLNVLLYESKRVFDAREVQQTLMLSRAGKLTEQFEQLVRLHFRTKKSVEDYAKLLFVSAKHLSKSVKETTGKSASALIQDAILLESKSLLFQSEMSISQIARALNFQDYAHFSNFFKQKTGVAPTDFRRERQILHKIAAY